MNNKDSVLESKLLDKIVKRQKISVKDQEVVNTAIRLLTDYEPVRLNKVAAVRRNKLLINQAIANKAFTGFVPNRLNSFPSYLTFHIVKLFSTLYNIPDKKLIIPGASEQVRYLMSAYADQVQRDGGYHDTLMAGWGGSRNQALNGDVVIGMGLRESGKKKGMPVFKEIPIQDCSFTPLSSGIRTKNGVGECGRFGYTIWMTKQAAEITFPGIVDIATSGALPSSDVLANDQSLSKEQIAIIEENKALQILIFTDKDYKVTAIIAGSNAALYQKLDGEKFPFEMVIDGEKQPYLNIVKGTFEALPDGIYGTGVGDMYGDLSDIETKIDSSQTNNLIDNLNAPAIVNVPGVEASSIFAQESMARKAIKEGKRAMMAFDAVDNNGQQLGRASIDYLRNNFPEAESQALIVKIETVIRRSGWNLDFLFTNPNKTNLQSELDIEANNQNIINIQSKNLDFYKVPTEFTIDAIRRFGDENDKTLFATDLKVDIAGEQVKVGELMEQQGLPAVTVGDMVKMFREHEVIEVEVDVKSGVAFNKRLEERNILKQLQHVAPGSPEQIKLTNALSLLNGGSESKKEDLTNDQGQIGVDGAAQQIQQTLAQ